MRSRAGELEGHRVRETERQRETERERVSEYEKHRKLEIEDKSKGMNLKL